MSLDSIKSILPATPTIGRVISSAVFPLVLQESLSPSTPALLFLSLLSVGVTNLAIIKLSNYTFRKIAELQFNGIKQKIKKCEATRALYKKAKKAMFEANREKLSLQLVDFYSSKDNFYTFKAECSNDGMIRISSKLPENEMQEAIIFELANASQASEFKVLDDQAESRLISKEDYIFCTEYFEWESARITKTVLEKAKQEQFDDWKAVFQSPVQIALLNLKDDNARIEWMKINIPFHLENYSIQYDGMIL